MKLFTTDVRRWLRKKESPFCHEYCFSRLFCKTSAAGWTKWSKAAITLRVCSIAKLFLNSLQQPATTLESFQEYYREYQGTFDDDEDSQDEDDDGEAMDADDNENSFKQSGDFEKVQNYFRLKVTFCILNFLQVPYFPF